MLILRKFNKNCNNCIISDNKYITYAELYKWVINQKKKTNMIFNTVGIFLPNSIEFIKAMLFVIASKKKLVILNYENNLHELNIKINNNDIDTLIVTESFYNSNKNYDAFEKINVILISEEELVFIKNKNLFLINYTQKKSLLVLPTSGTTNQSKNVVLYEKRIIKNAIQHIKGANLKQKDSMAIILPMSSISCITAQIFSSLILGCNLLILQKNVSINDCVEKIKKFEIKSIGMVPSKFNLYVNYLAMNDIKDLPLCIIWIGGDRIDNEKVKEYLKLYPNCSVYNIYGQTELSPRATMINLNLFPHKNNCVGLPIKGVKIKIYDDSMNLISKPFISGKILIKSKYIMKEYYKNIDLTKKAFYKKFLITGDIGYFDKEKFLYIVGREKNIIICGGENIFPEEIEEVIKKIGKDILEICVYPEKNLLLNEIPVVDIVKNPLANVTDLELKNKVKAHCSQFLSGNRIPFKINIVKEIKKTESGKIKRRK